MVKNAHQVVIFGSNVHKLRSETLKQKSLVGEKERIHIFLQRTESDKCDLYSTENYKVIGQANPLPEV